MFTFWRSQYFGVFYVIKMQILKALAVDGAAVLLFSDVLLKFMFHNTENVKVQYCDMHL
jgi:hypothetical protein